MYTFKRKIILIFQTKATGHVFVILWLNVSKMPVDDAKGANNIQNVVNDSIYDVWHRRRTIPTTLDL